MKWKISCALLGLLSVVMALYLCYSIRREAQITSFSAIALLAFIENEESVPRVRVEQIISLMEAKGMRDMSSAVVMFDLLKKSDEHPVTNDSNVLKFIDEMKEKYKGRDRPFLDRL